ncbi:MAG: Permease YjgP/YjgQ family protein [Verrucomicrobiales bacterium]|jgi:lipopolysaccharide export system permease protein|nr:Permease YjgP/YjgQ family protein [Verrucomicrobiales bacterium]
MKTLQIYLIRQILATLAMTVMVFTFVLLIGNVLQEILKLLVNGQASLGVVFQAIALLIPWVLVFALPMGMLTATLLVFGRFSADQELTAARAGGVSLITLVTPILLLSILLCILSAWINLEVAPMCRIAYKNLLYRSLMQKPTSLLRENQYVNDLPGGLTVFVKKINGTNLTDVLIVQSDLKENRQTWERAEKGYIVMGNTVELVLINALGGSRQGDNLIPNSLSEVSFPLGNISSSGAETRVSDMSFRQLMDQLKKIEDKSRFAFRAGGADSEELKAQVKELARFEKEMALPIRVQLHRQISFSFACFGFTLIGIPLAIQTQRRETSIGMAISLVLVLVYYSFIILGQSLETRADFQPHLIVWLPNFIFQGVGGFLLFRANKRG